MFIMHQQQSDSSRSHIPFSAQCMFFLMYYFLRTSRFCEYRHAAKKHQNKTGFHSIFCVPLRLSDASGVDTARSPAHGDAFSTQRPKEEEGEGGGCGGGIGASSARRS